MRALMIILAGLFSVGLNAQDLDSLKVEALQNNSSVLASYNLFKAELERVAQVNTLPDPQLSAGVFIQPIETRVGPQVAKVSISQLFPWFGSLRARGDVAALQAEAAYAVFLNQKLLVTRDLEMSYFDWIEWHESIAILLDDISLLERILSTAEIQAEAGKASLANVLRLQIRLEDMRSNLRQLKNQEAVILSKLRSHLNRTDTNSIQLEAQSIDSFDLTLTWPMDTSIGSHPRISRLRSLRKSEQSRMEAARKAGYPSIGLGIDYMFVNKRSDISVPSNGQDAVMPMISISLPLFRSKYNASVREAQLRQTAYEHQSQSETNELRNEWESVKYEWLFNLEELKRLSKNVDRASSTLRLLESTYETDGIDFNGVLEVEEVLLKYRLQELSANVNLLKTKSQLNYLLGENFE